MDETYLTPYMGSDLTGFNGATTKPWRTAIADLVAVPSTAHLKMKYYTHKGQVATLYGDIEAARICFNASSKGNEYIGEAPEAKKPKHQHHHLHQTSAELTWTAAYPRKKTRRKRNCARKTKRMTKLAKSTIV
ncbi:hypothetical protein L195_g056820 [Trifolium pratense]|uniref:Uncharacterized protein n=1 Tax=Trifolium pratense TaxID=57577 RepID=A0A2K3KTL8_TRIPR|nr:hypothetical protein L195_g056820 [Trifolium pratense]